MELDEFRTELHNRVAIWAEVDANFRHSSFVDVAVELLADAGEVADFEPCFYRGVSGRRNVGIDGYAFDDADDSLRLFIAAPGFDAAGTLTRTDATPIFARLRAFVEDAIAGKLGSSIDENSPALGFAEELASRASKILRIRAYLLTDATLSTFVKDWPDGSVAGIPIEFHIWDITRFHRAYTSTTGQDDLVVDFAAITHDGIPCLEASTLDGPYSAYLCVIPGAVLATIYNNYGSRLLEGNVRSFLSTKGKVNKGIRNTIVHQPEMFFAYNNGIAATASSVEVRKADGGLVLLSASDFQIVNGGQTTASLAVSQKTHENQLASTFVPMKLSVIGAAQSGEMIPLISRYANSQNTVSAADFFSNHEYHRRLETMSRRLWAPAQAGAQYETHWFYERARGQYVNEPASLRDTQRKAFFKENPRGQLVTKTDLAKCELSWQQLPHRVSRGAQSAFLDFADDVSKRWVADQYAFHEEYFRQVVARLIVFRSTEKIVSEQPWYSGGYRANIVTYAVAKLAHEVASAGVTVDLDAIWQRQAISAAMRDQLAVITRSAYEVITNPREGHQNVTQWCKRHECWLLLKESHVSLVPAMALELISPGDQKEGGRAARSQQLVDSGIDSQAAVVVLGFEYWNEVLSWAKEHGKLPAIDERALKAAAGHYGSLATEKQCRRVLELKKQFELEGLKPVTR